MAPTKLKLAKSGKGSGPDETGTVAEFPSASKAEGIFILDSNGVVLSINDGAVELFGFAHDDLTGHDIADLLASPEGGLAAFLGFAPGSEVEDPPPHTVICRRKDGFALVLDVRVCRLLGSSKGSYAVQVRYGEVETEEDWQEAESRLAGFAANIPGIVYQRIMQPDGVISYPFISNGVEDLLGSPVEEINVNSEGCLEVVHWADRDDLMATIRASAEDLHPFNEEFRAIARTGEVKWLSGISRPQRMSSGEIMWDGVLVDITERKLAEQRLEMIMDHAYDSIVTISEKGVIESANGSAERLFGYRSHELLGRNVSMLMDEPDRSRHDDYVSRYLETGESHLLGKGPMELTGLRSDGAHVPIELALSEVRMEGRRIFIGVARDITQRRMTEARLRETEQRLLGIASNLPGMVFQQVLHRDGSICFTYASEGSREILGIEPEEMVDDFDLFLDALDRPDREAYQRKLRQSATILEVFTHQVKVTTRAGSTKWLSAWARPRRLDNGDVAWDGVKLDITDRKLAEDRLTYLAYFDPVTKLPNREKFFQAFDLSCQAADHLKQCAAVLSLGLDRFGIINASMGHSVGDQVLKAAARRLSQCLGATNVVARAGGDRFLGLIRGMTAEVELVEIIDNVIRRFQEPLVVDGQEFDLTVSIGASMYPRDGSDAETLIKNADAALNRAKSQGPGSVQLFTAEMGARAAKTLSTQVRIRHGIEKNEFVPYFQPQVDVLTGATVGMEALARWQDSESGQLIPPVEFISVAEEYGLIDAIAEQILLKACQTNKAWQDEGTAHVQVAVNLSGRQFHNSRKLLSTVDQVLKETGLDPKFLELELTESSAMSDPENAIAVVRSLRDMGIACSIDDFGTGYSSLSWLKRFPIHKLKIDRSFVMDVITDPNDAAIVGAVVAMAHALKLKVVAEGVEDMRHYDFLRKLGCDQIQGYLIAKPLSAEAMRDFFLNGKWQPIRGV
ncbi:MAG: diguanylate cyclase [Alphaproteobacteria bacterium RIFOXYD12_FULL_60_8]|nr:MAG: diguanylate cyclase [Alphaproteobacteria bacterium RIFOXYD12_FULL_60_8]